MKLELKVSGPYDFAGSVCDHGWVGLSPCAWISEQNALQRVERLATGRVVLLDVTSVNSGEDIRILVDVRADGPIASEEQDEIRRKVRWMLRLDEDLSGFYQLCCRDEHLRKKMGKGRGRLLRSPTLFEDAVKTICTTNTTWAQTVGTIDRLVKCLGDPCPFDPNLRAFPTPPQVAAATEKLFREEIRTGYRSAYLLRLAREVVDGRTDLEALKTGSLPAGDLKRELKRIKGIGCYAASTLLMILGYYGDLAIDSQMRSRVSNRHFKGGPVTDQQIEAIYNEWGKWKYLAYWFELV